jgi:3-deoxy-7-phosphoheptulonate synthase
VHDPEAGLEYARRLKPLADAVSDRLLLVMRVYFEKPRTTVGWKGLIMDPHLDGSSALADGLQIARGFLRDVIEIGLPTATELLDPITPQYISDLICYSAIGARTTESQTHRQMASGLSMPMGFKNSTDGNITHAINAIQAASQPQTFLGISQSGQAASLTTRGNPACHIILRGGTGGPNFSAEHVLRTQEKLRDAGMIPALMVDCSHGNSEKDPERQPEVLRNLMEQVNAGNQNLIGAMLESNLQAGKQPFPQPKDQLRYGQSITDGCIDIDTTEAVIREAYAALGGRFA